MTNNYKKLSAVALITVLSFIGLAIAAAPAADTAVPRPTPAKPRLVVLANKTCKNCNKANQFWLRFEWRKIKPLRSGAICWLGNCKSRAPLEQYTVSVFHRSVGPYRCGSKTRATLYYGGKKYTRSAKINCRGFV